MNHGMPDMTMLEELGSALDPPTAGPPAALRGRVLAAATQPPVRPGRGAGLRWRLVAAGAMAAALTAALFITHTVQVGGHAPVARAEAAEILQQSARAARADATPLPRPDQFVFTESVTVGESLSVEADGTQRTRAATPTVSRVWRSVDGTRDGLLRTRPKSGTGGWSQTLLPRCGLVRRGDATAASGRQVTAPAPAACKPVPAYRSDLPTDGAGMLAYLNARAQLSAGHDEANPGWNVRARALFAAVEDTLHDWYLPAPARAALFEAAATIPGMSVVHDVVDDAGRHGVAVGVSDGAGRADLIFDPKTYQLLGSREVAGAQKGTLQGHTTILRVVIVDRAGQLPG
jgi:hypothetical protein